MAGLSDMGIKPRSSEAELLVEDGFIWLQFPEEIDYCSMTLEQAKLMHGGLTQAIAKLEEIEDATKRMAH
jgi:hypothetical protein